MRDAVVILGGAFNPVHTQHIAMLCLAKEELEKSGAWNIIGGYLAVATDGYVLSKLRSRNERTMKLRHRLALVTEAMKDIPWLRDSPFQDEMLKQQDGSALSLGERLKRLIRNDDLQIFVLVGGDRMIKKGIPIWRTATRSSSAAIRVGIGRVTDENINLLELWQEDLSRNLIHHPNEFRVLNGSLRSVSSSLVRIHLQQWFNSTDQQAIIENDLVTINSFLTTNVMNYIKHHPNDLYIDS